MQFHVSLIFAVLVTLTHAATHTVHNTSDSGPGSLRQAVMDAAASPGTDTVVFNPASFLPLTRIGALGTSCDIDDNTLENHSVPAGNNRALVVAACHAADTDITGVTFGGLPLTQVIERTDGYVVVSFWTRAMGSSATPITGDIVVTRAGNDSRVQTTFAVNFANVDQSLPMDSPVADPNTVALTTAVTVSSRPGDLVLNLMDGFKWVDLPVAKFIAGEGQTRLHAAHGLGFEDGSESYATSVKPGDGVETMEWTGDQNVFFHIAANIRAAAAINLSSEISVNDTDGITIDGSALPRGVTLSGENLTRILHIAPSTNLTLRRLSFSRGNGPASEPQGTGGAVCNQAGTIAMEDCSFVTSHGFRGGALSNLGGSITLTRCNLSGNSAASNGGGINNDQGNCTLSHCTLSGNRATGKGGGIHSAEAPTAMEIKHCTASGNISDNTTSDGIHVSHQTTALFNSIVSENGSGDVVNDGGQFQRQGANLIGIFANEGSPLIGTDSGPSAINDIPHLAPLANYGGPTRTLALLSTSPARDASIGSTATSDQRGFPIVNTADIGAYESGNLLQNYEAWAVETLPESLNPEQRAATCDLDGDGATNANEWTAGTDIEDAASIFRIINFTAANGIIHAVCSTVSGRSYVLQTSNDLSSWENVPGTARSGNGLDLSYDLGALPNSFFRISVTP